MYFVDLVAILSGFKISFRTFFVFKTKKHFLSLQRVTFLCWKTCFFYFKEQEYSCSKCFHFTSFLL